uniref:Aminotransferase class I/classII large domain-containing protein n=1 Tax=Pyramimonas obovata TaxID=1411642 RepID=A0A7S0R006_9CHLO|mmetsp:Transcript_20681/g.45320  ORF Transcript_20681/g.45320 Transcript_20681/m.45320 type:complete len:411 (+) Transcript_20681:46-1278(+)
MSNPGDTPIRELGASIRASKVPPFYVMEVMKAATAREKQGEKVLHMEVGQPSTGAPAGALEAAQSCLASSAAGTDTLGYTLASGTAELRARIARHYEHRYAVQVSEESIVITTGSSAGFVLSFLACFESGDRVAIAAPGYPCYRNILEALGVTVVTLPVDASTNFQPTPAHLEQAAKEGPLRGLVVASPSNPTGTVLTKQELFALQAWCLKSNVWFISDEIYHQIEYGEERATTALEGENASKNTVVINSFSKYHCMTGWRVGWVVVPEKLLSSMVALQQNLFINAPTISQHAAAAAFDCDEELLKHVERYRLNRQILLEGLPVAGFSKLSSAGGGFYIYADVSNLGGDSVALCKRILETTGVALTPGVDFDRERGARFLRFSFCGSTDCCREVVRLLQTDRRWLAPAGE